MTIPAREPGAVVVQYQDGAGVWQTFGAAQDLGSLSRSRRVGPGPRRPVTARHWRIVKAHGFDWGASVFSIDQVKFWREGDALSPVRIEPFSFDDKQQRYFLVRTPGNIEVYWQHQRMCAIPTPHGADILKEVRRTQILDTFLQFHATTPPHRIMRQGAHDQWDSRPLAFDSLPKFDFTGERLGGVDEVQQIRFESYTNGDTFNITLEGETTSSIIYTNIAATMIDRLRSALEALGNVGAGGVTVTSSGVDSYDLTFVGANRAADLGEIAPKTIVGSSSNLVLGATITQGKAGGEPIMSAARGWCRSGTFYQGRLWLAGLKSRPQTAIASRLGDWFNFESQGSAKAIAVDIDTDENTTIDAIFPGQHLQVFTSSAEFFFTTEPLTPPPPIKRATRRGISLGLPIHEMAGASIFITAGASALAEYLYDEVRSTYSAAFVSKWASHLLAGTAQAPVSIVDFGFRRAYTPTECDRAIMPRSDGLAAVMIALREEGVTGFVRWETAGQFLAAAADLGRDEYVAVQRGDEIFLERVDASAMLDAQVSYAVTEDPIEGPVDVPHLDGQTVTLYIDGGDAGDHPVVAGKVTLPHAALREVLIGIGFDVKARGLPGVLQGDQRGGSTLEGRMPGIEFELGPSGPFTAGIAGGHMWDVKLNRSTVANEGPGLHPFVGWGRVEGAPGFRPDLQWEILQTRPGPLEIKQIVYAGET